MNAVEDESISWYKVSSKIDENSMNRYNDEYRNKSEQSGIAMRRNMLNKIV